MSNVKATIMDALTALMKRETLNKAFFKVKAYKKVIEELKISDKPITKISDLDNIPGVGEQIRKKVQEILETGGLAAAEKAKKDLSLDALDELSGIYGVGPTKAKELIGLGIKSIKQLREAIAKEPGILNEKQKIGVQYYEDICARIPRSEMEQHEKVLLGALLEGMKGTVVGSYRRGAKDSGDIDVLITMEGKTVKQRAAAFHEYIEKLKSSGYMSVVLSEGDQKCLSIVKLGPTATSRRLDLLLVPSEQFPFALLYFTGSGDFNIAFRKHALSLGYTLNEQEMKLTGKKEASAVPSFKHEAEIFAFLGLKYKEPNQRLGAASVVELTENIKAKVAAVRATRKAAKKL